MKALILYYGESYGLSLIQPVVDFAAWQANKVASESSFVKALDLGFRV